MLAGWEVNDIVVVRQDHELPLSDRFFGTRHSGEHDMDREHDFKLSPDDVHVLAVAFVVGDVLHKNRHSLAHTRPLKLADSARDVRGRSLSRGLTKVNREQLSALLTTHSSIAPLWSMKGAGVSAPSSRTIDCLA